MGSSTVKGIEESTEFIGYIWELILADDMTLISDADETIQRNILIYQKELKKLKIEINIDKSNTMTKADRKKKHNINIEGEILTGKVF